MPPLPLTWPGGIPLWLAYWWAFVAELPFMRRAWASPVPKSDRRSLRVILLAGILAGAGAFVFAGVLPAAEMKSRIPAYIAGIGLIIASGLLRRHCFAMLGNRFTYAVQVASDQAVVETGAYRYVRHPSYSAGLMLFTGIGLALGNWASLAAGVLPIAFAYSYRIAVEERLLVQNIGTAYESYMKRTRRLIPFVF